METALAVTTPYKTPAEVLAQRQKPKEVPKQKPNEPCLCGSGKKFKRCCGFALVPRPKKGELPACEVAGAVPGRDDVILVKFEGSEDLAMVPLTQIARNADHAEQLARNNNKDDSMLPAPRAEPRRGRKLLASKESESESEAKLLAKRGAGGGGASDGLLRLGPGPRPGAGPRPEEGARPQAGSKKLGGAEKVGAAAPPRGAEADAAADTVCVVLPVHNGEQWLDGCLGSLLRQTALATAGVSVSLSAYDDGSTDGTWAALQRWAPKLEAAGVHAVLGQSGAATGGGCGFAKNRAVAQSSSGWLCFQVAPPRPPPRPRHRARPPLRPRLDLASISLSSSPRPPLAGCGRRDGPAPDRASAQRRARARGRADRLTSGA